MKQLNIFKRIKIFFKYHIGRKEFISDDKMNNYIPDIVFERNVILYIIGYIPEYDVYRMTVQQYNQGLDV